MTTFRKTIRTGVAAALLLAGLTTGVQGQVVWRRTAAYQRHRGLSGV